MTIKSAWILGSTSTVAKATINNLAKLGCKRFHLLSRNIELNKSFGEMLFQKYGCLITYEFVDLEKIDNQEKKISQIYDLYFVCAGTLGKPLLARQDLNEAMNIINVNFCSILPWLNAIVNEKRINHAGSLWIMSSVAADIGRPSNYHYGASKAALTKFCEGLMLRCNDKPFNIRIIKAGYISSPMTQGKAPELLCISPDSFAKSLLSQKHRRGIEYKPLIWFFIMQIIKLLPKKLLSKM